MVNIEGIMEVKLFTYIYIYSSASRKRELFYLAVCGRDLRFRICLKNQLILGVNWRHVVCFILEAF